MTTLPVARAEAEAQYSPENCPDRDFAERELVQIYEMTLERNPYHTYEDRLPPEEKAVYGWLEPHPEGFELSFNQWVESGAAERYAKEHKLYLAFKALTPSEQAEYGWTESRTPCFRDWKYSDAARKFLEAKHNES